MKRKKMKPTENQQSEQLQGGPPRILELGIWQSYVFLLISPLKTDCWSRSNSVSSLREEEVQRVLVYYTVMEGNVLSGAASSLSPSRLWRFLERGETEIQTGETIGTLLSGKYIII